uniref:hypothetical protein n=1 Tax=Ningiella ruwaisensis TaxID=2364274 RepID=UPI00109EEC35|nr:hypothetical protein [Ningiella ruwaisensis]
MLNITPRALFASIFASVFASTMLIGLCTTASANPKSDAMQEPEIQMIKIKSNDQETVELEVVNNFEDAKIYKIDKLDLENEAHLQAVLFDLDESTRKNVIDALKELGKNKDRLNRNVGEMEEIKKMMVLRTGEIEGLEAILDETSNTHIITALKNVENLKPMIAKSKADALISLLEGGEFTPEQLDRIQSALDSKR